VEIKNGRNCKVATVDSTGTEGLGVGAAFVKCVTVVVIVTTQPFQSFTHLSCYFTDWSISRERDEEIVCNINNNINTMQWQHYDMRAKLYIYS